MVVNSSPNKKKIETTEISSHIFKLRVSFKLNMEKTFYVCNISVLIKKMSNFLI